MFSFASSLLQSTVLLERRGGQLLDYIFLVTATHPKPHCFNLSRFLGMSDAQLTTYDLVEKG